MAGEEVAADGDEVPGAVGVAPGAGGGGDIGDNDDAAEQAIDQRAHGVVTFDNAGGAGAEFGGGWFGRGFGGALGEEGEGGDAGFAAFIGAEVGEDLLGGFGLIREDELEVDAEGGFDGEDVLVGDADAVGERTEDGLRLLEGGERAGAEAFVAGDELFEDAEA